MDIQTLFLTRYNVLYDGYLADVWQNLTQDQMRQRSNPHLNSIAWNLWHIARVEDAGINRFVADRNQVYDHDWAGKMNLSLSHYGTAMSYDEVDELTQQINLDGLKEYMGAVRGRTGEVINALTPTTLDLKFDHDELHKILIEGELAHPNAHWLVDAYLGWTKGKALIHFGLTHSFQHIGEISTLASLLDVEVFG